MQSPRPRRLLRTKEAAEFLTLTPVSLAKKRVSGTGPRFIRLGPKTIAYDLADVEAWLESRRTMSTSEPLRS